MRSFICSFVDIRRGQNKDKIDLIQIENGQDKPRNIFLIKLANNIIIILF